MRILGILVLSVLHVSQATSASNQLKMDCDLGTMGVSYRIEGLLEEASPEDQLEKYRFHGKIHFEDNKRPDQRQDFAVVGRFDDRGGVFRSYVRPIAPQLFNIFTSIDFIQFKNGHQLVTITSDHGNGPNGGTNGNLCRLTF